jgi:hypothetical protein
VVVGVVVVLLLVVDSPALPEPPIVSLSPVPLPEALDASVGMVVAVVVVVLALALALALLPPSSPPQAVVQNEIKAAPRKGGKSRMA